MRWMTRAVMKDRGLFWMVNLFQSFKTPSSNYFPFWHYWPVEPEPKSNDPYGSWNRLGRVIRRPRQTNGSEGRRVRNRDGRNCHRSGHGSFTTDNFAEKKFCSLLLYTFLKIRWYWSGYFQQILVFLYLSSHRYSYMSLLFSSRFIA